MCQIVLVCWCVSQFLDFPQDIGALPDARTAQNLLEKLEEAYTSNFLTAMQDHTISERSLVFVAEETGLKLALSETPKTGFLATRPICSFAKLLCGWNYSYVDIVVWVSFLLA